MKKVEFLLLRSYGEEWKDWTLYKMTGFRRVLKADCNPHKFLCAEGLLLNDYIGNIYVGKKTNVYFSHFITNLNNDFLEKIHSVKEREYKKV